MKTKSNFLATKCGCEEFNFFNPNAQLLSYWPSCFENKNLGSSPEKICMTFNEALTLPLTEHWKSIAKRNVCIRCCYYHTYGLINYYCMDYLMQTNLFTTSSLQQFIIWIQWHPIFSASTKELIIYNVKTVAAFLTRHKVSATAALDISNALEPAVAKPLDAELLKRLIYEAKLDKNSNLDSFIQLALYNPTIPLENLVLLDEYDIDFRRNRILITPVNFGRQHEVLFHNSSKPLLRVLLKQTPSGERIFPFEFQEVSKIIQKLLTKIGLNKKEYNIHSLTATSFKKLYESGVKIRSVIHDKNFFVYAPAEFSPGYYLKNRHLNKIEFNL